MVRQTAERFLPDARTRFFAAVLLSFAAAFSSGIPAACAALSAAFLLILRFQPDAGRLRTRLITANAFILFLWFLTPFTAAGEPLFSAGPLTATREGILLSLLVTLKCNAIVITIAALTAGLTLSESASGLQALGLPPKLTALLLFTGRYTGTLAAEYRRLRDAMRLRGFSPRTDRFTYRVYANLIGLLFVRAFDRAERTGEAMRLRGFDGVHLRLLTSSQQGDLRSNVTLTLFAAACVLLEAVLTAF